MSEELRKTIEDTMQRYWNDWCSDTGCVPPEFTIRGPKTTRVYADFRESEMAERIVEVILSLPAQGVSQPERTGDET